MDPSTVSKVLKNKEKYLSEHGLQGKTSVPMFEAPAIESALLSWIKSQQRQGRLLDDQKVNFQAGRFAHICRCPEFAKEITTDGWLKDFKRKYITNMGPHKKPTSPESQNHSCTPASTNCAMDKSDIQRLNQDNGAPFSLSPNEIDDCNHTTGGSPLVGEELKVKQALELVNMYFECQGPGLSVDESESLERFKNSLEERILSSVRNSQG